VLINLVSYLDPFSHDGGGEMANRELLSEGIRRGHTFTFTSMKPRKNEYSDKADFDLLIDIFNSPHTIKSGGFWIRFPESFLQEILNRGKFFHHNNAYVDICNLGYLPCSGNSTALCPHKSATRIRQNFITRDFSKACYATSGAVRNFFTNSLANSFVSPLHDEVTRSVLGIADLPESIVVKPLIDTSLFHRNGELRDIEYLFVGVVSEAKGYRELREKYKDKDIHIVGKVAPGITLDFGTSYGRLDYSEVARLMTRAQNFVFTPRWPEPQGRVVVEAALSGCNLILNDNVGAASFPFDLSDASNYVDSAELFWLDVERIWEKNG